MIDTVLRLTGAIALSALVAIFIMVLLYAIALDKFWRPRRRCDDE